MEKVYSLINSPLDTFIALLCAALLSIFGAFIKDWLLKLFSLFSLRFKKRRVANSRRIYRQARLLLRDPIFLSLYIFSAVKMSLMWVIANVSSILLALFLQQRAYDLLKGRNLDTISVGALKSFDPNVFHLIVLLILMILMILTFAVAMLAGFKSAARSHILYKALRIRVRQLSINIKLP